MIKEQKRNPKKYKEDRRPRPAEKLLRTVTRGIKRPRICAKCLIDVEMLPEEERDTKIVYPRRHGSKYCNKHAVRV